ncbi:MAG: hypothetical protein PVG30_03630 [Gammaproteobacteria bacterium]|jgi:hypothetical protein
MSYNNITEYRDKISQIQPINIAQQQLTRLQEKLKMQNLQIIYSKNEIAKLKHNDRKLSECFKMCQETESFAKENFYKNLYSLGQLGKFKNLFPDENNPQTAKTVLKSLENIQKENDKLLKIEEQRHAELLFNRNEVLLLIQKSDSLPENEKQYYSQPEKMLESLKGLLRYE